MKRLAHFLSYKPLYGENPFVFYASRLKNTIIRDSYEKNDKRLFSVPPGESADLFSVMEVLESNISDYITDRDVNGLKGYKHINSLQHSKVSHNLLGSKTWCKALCYRFLLTKDPSVLDLLLEGVSYLISKRNQTGIFRYEQPLGLSQDEGPVTAGAIQVFCSVYSLAQEQKYLDLAVETAEAAKKYIYTKDYGYVHTRGCAINTTNINSSFGEAFASLFKLTDDPKWKDETVQCARLVVGNQLEDGMFLYGSNLPRLFVSLYHYMVMISLEKIRSVVEVEGYDRVKARAAAFGKSLIDPSGYIAEPDENGKQSYFRCGTRAALMYELLGDHETAAAIEASFGSFINDRLVYSAINRERTSLSDGKYWYRRERHLADAYCDLAQILWCRAKREGE